MKSLLLIAALVAGGMFLNHAMNKPGPITMSDARVAADQGVQAAEGAAATAEKTVDTVSSIARTGARAAESTSGFVGDAADAGSRLFDSVRRTVSDPDQPPERTLVKPRAANPGGAGSAGTMRSRKTARDALPEELVVPEQQPAPSAVE